jgi:hypothetical protein
MPIKRGDRASQIGFDRNFDSIGFDFSGDMMFPQVGVTKTPASGFVGLFFTVVPLDRAFRVVRPGCEVGLVDHLERERLLQPASLVPCLQHGVNRIAEMEGRRFGLLHFEHVAEVELQPALQEQ